MLYQLLTTVIYNGYYLKLRFNRRLTDFKNSLLGPRPRRNHILCHQFRVGVDGLRILLETIHDRKLFSDQKSYSFGIGKSRLSEPMRLARLLFGACTVCVWPFFWGLLATEPRYMKLIHRRGRCVPILFQLGPGSLMYLASRGMPLSETMPILSDEQNDAGQNLSKNKNRMRFQCDIKRVR